MTKCPVKSNFNYSEYLEICNLTQFPSNITIINYLQLRKSIISPIKLKSPIILQCTIRVRDGSGILLCSQRNKRYNGQPDPQSRLYGRDCGTRPK